MSCVSSALGTRFIPSADECISDGYTQRGSWNWRECRQLWLQPERLTRDAAVQKIPESGPDLLNQGPDGCATGDCHGQARATGAPERSLPAPYDPPHRFLRLGSCISRSDLE